MERAICHGPRQPVVADDHRPIDDPGNNKLPDSALAAPCRDRAV